MISEWYKPKWPTFYLYGSLWYLWVCYIKCVSSLNYPNIMIIVMSIVNSTVAKTNLNPCLYLLFSQYINQWAIDVENTSNLHKNLTSKTGQICKSNWRQKHDVHLTSAHWCWKYIQTHTHFWHRFYVVTPGPLKRRQFCVTWRERDRCGFVNCCCRLLAEGS